MKTINVLCVWVLCFTLICSHRSHRLHRFLFIFNLETTHRQENVIKTARLSENLPIPARKCNSVEGVVFWVEYVSHFSEMESVESLIHRIDGEVLTPYQRENCDFVILVE